MKIKAKKVDLEKLQKDAEEFYRGGLFCCEALVKAVRDNFMIDVSDDIIKMSSGMSVGAGKSGCMCGALNGGILALGLLFGRSESNGPKDPVVVKCMELTHELHEYFKGANGKNSVCCRVLTKGFDMASGEHKAQCIGFTGLVARKCGEIIAREYNIDTI